MIKHGLPFQIPVVRANAASGLEFLQDPSPQCPVTTALLSLMEKDSSPEVRRAILSRIAVSNRTLAGVTNLSCIVKSRNFVSQWCPK